MLSIQRTALVLACLAVCAVATFEHPGAVIPTGVSIVNAKRVIKISSNIEEQVCFGPFPSIHLPIIPTFPSLRLIISLSTTDHLHHSNAYLHLASQIYRFPL